MQPFDTVDVLDLTQSVAGPLSTQFLGMLGANVVKVEPPGGDPFRTLVDGAMFASVNLAGKRSVCLDLKTDEGVTMARELATRADVVVESFRPGVLEQFDLDYESIIDENDDVVYCSVTGYGQDGPRSEWPAYDPMIQASTGLMASVSESDRPPIRIGASLIDYGTGLLSAFLIASALHDRERTGEGEYIDVSLFDVGTWYMGYWIAHYTGTGEVPHGPGHGLAGVAPNGGFFAADDEPFYLSVVNDEFFERLCRSIERDDLLEDDRYRTNAARCDHRDALRDELDDEFRTWDRDELVATLADAGVTVAPVQTVDELVADAHVDARGLLTDSYNLHRDTAVKTASPPFRTSSGRPDIGDRPPACGEHTRDVLAELGYDAEFIGRLLETGAVSE